MGEGGGAGTERESVKNAENAPPARDAGIKPANESPAPDSPAETRTNVLAEILERHEKIAGRLRGKR